jgi:hypothetical protein
MFKLYILTSVTDVVAPVTLNYQLIQNSLEFDVTDGFKRPRRQEVPLWDESLAADKNHSPLSAW